MPQILGNLGQLFFECRFNCLIKRHLLQSGRHGKSDLLRCKEQNGRLQRCSEKGNQWSLKSTKKQMLKLQTDWKESYKQSFKGCKSRDKESIYSKQKRCKKDSWKSGGKVKVKSEGNSSFYKTIRLCHIGTTFLFLTFHATSERLPVGKFIFNSCWIHFCQLLKTNSPTGSNSFDGNVIASTIKKKGAPNMSLLVC